MEKLSNAQSLMNCSGNLEDNAESNAYNGSWLVKFPKKVCKTLKDSISDVHAIYFNIGICGSKTFEY